MTTNFEEPYMLRSHNSTKFPFQPTRQIAVSPTEQCYETLNPSQNDRKVPYNSTASEQFVILVT